MRRISAIGTSEKRQYIGPLLLTKLEQKGAGTISIINGDKIGAQKAQEITETSVKFLDSSVFTVIDYLKCDVLKSA